MRIFILECATTSSARTSCLKKVMGKKSEIELYLSPTLHHVQPFSCFVSESFLSTLNPFYVRLVIILCPDYGVPYFGQTVRVVVTEASMPQNKIKRSRFRLYLVPRVVRVLRLPTALLLTRLLLLLLCASSH
jgi:hypothetical protein